MKKIAAVIMAAGKSKRMKSKTSKVLHKIMGKPVIDYVLESCRSAGVDEIILVVGYKKEMLMEYLGGTVGYAHQDEQLGTGHAVMQAMPLLENFEGDIFILSGDMPLLSGETLSKFVSFHREKSAKISLLTAELEDPGKLGRIIRGRDGSVEKIVEAVDATADQLKIREVNTGTYVFDAGYLREILPKAGRPNTQNEIYLTDTIVISREEGVAVEAMICKDSNESLGVNSRVDMAVVSEIMRKSINGKLMFSGVTLYDPANTYVEAGVEIGNDTEILPGCMIMGKTKIGSDCIVGPHTRIIDSTVGNGSTVSESVINNAIVGDNNTIGPFAHLRPQTATAENVKIGNFCETKKSSIGKGSKVPHLSYIGDTEMGERVNIGAGTITCNYDGKKKNPTTIGDGVFIGSNTSIVAPRTIGEGAATGAGTVVNKDIPDWTLAVGLPSRNVRKLK